MNEFKVIVVMNETMLEVLKDKNRNYDINLKIQEYLKDETVFFRIQKDFAFKILQNVGVMESKIEEVYKKLTSQSMFWELVNTGKLKEDDTNLIIKYDKNVF